MLIEREYKPEPKWIIIEEPLLTVSKVYVFVRDWNCISFTYKKCWNDVVVTGN